MATKMTYKEQLLHPNWQRKRLEMLEAAGWLCSCCGGAETTLHVHHRRYIKGRMAWEYENKQLNVLCATCHENEHANREVLERLLSESDMGESVLPMTIGLLAGFLDADVAIDSDLVQAAISIDGHSYHLGVFAAMAAGAGWKRMAEAANVVKGRSLSPAMETALTLWEGRDA